MNDTHNFLRSQKNIELPVAQNENVARSALDVLKIVDPTLLVSDIDVVKTLKMGANRDLSMIKIT